MPKGCQKVPKGTEQNGNFRTPSFNLLLDIKLKTKITEKSISVLKKSYSFVYTLIINWRLKQIIYKKTNQKMQKAIKVKRKINKKQKNQNSQNLGVSKKKLNIK